MPSDNQRCRRRGATDSRRQGEHVVGLERVHTGNADEIGSEVAEVLFDRSAEPEIGDTNIVTAALERRGDVFHAQRLDSKEGAQPEAFARWNGTEQQDLHEPALNPAHDILVPVLVPSFERVVTWAHRRRVLVLAGAALFVALASAGLPRLTFDPDVLRLLPTTGRAVPAFRDYLQTFGTLDDLYVVFSTVEGEDIRDDAEEIDRWIEALRAAPELQRVDSGQIDGTRDWSWLADRQLLLFDEVRLPQAVARLQPSGMPASTRRVARVAEPAFCRRRRPRPRRPTRVERAAADPARRRAIDAADRHVA